VALEAEKRAIRGMAYEARLALGKAEMKYGKQAAGRERLAGVEKDAASSGFMLVARKAGAFREGRPQASDVRRRASDLGPQPSDLGRQTSDVGASDFCPRALKKLATDFTDSHG
jgi:hypothetical protein